MSYKKIEPATYLQTKGAGCGLLLLGPGLSSLLRSGRMDLRGTSLSYHLLVTLLVATAGVLTRERGSARRCAFTHNALTWNQPTIHHQQVHHHKFEFFLNKIIVLKLFNISLVSLL